MTIVETRKRAKFSIEVIHQLLNLPEDAVIRDIRFEDIDHGIVTCYYVQHDDEETTPEGEGSIIYTTSDKLYKERKSISIPNFTHSVDYDY